MIAAEILNAVQKQPGVHYHSIAKDLGIVSGRVLHVITRDLKDQVVMADGLCTAITPAFELVAPKPTVALEKQGCEPKCELRPYINCRANGLAEIASENWDNLSALKQLHAETLFRSKPAATKLALRLASRIKALNESNEPKIQVDRTSLDLVPGYLDEDIEVENNDEFLDRDQMMEYENLDEDVINSEAQVIEPQLSHGFAYDSLESLRNKLLDLTGRNRLLNYHHGRGGYVRVIDELPDQLHALLLSDAILRFSPVPEPSKEELIDAGYIMLGEDGQEVRQKKDPTAKEWAEQIGLATSYELPMPSLDITEEGRHQDVLIQTLLYPYELETQLRGLRSKAQTAIEETGANILYLAFGFLEWFESNDSDVVRLAPLYLVPVKMEKGYLDQDQGTYSYTLQYTGEDIVTNLSLREKLKLDFGIALPELDENTTPEEYFVAVADRIDRNKSGWKVKRYCTLSLLNFGKLLMYLDLDPSRWPHGVKNITEHEIVKRFFATHSAEGEGGSGFHQEYEIDDIASVHELYPLIDDADSSQHSALVDVIKGKNLVIEGPPGTGKSQTITNLIAAAIVQGKKVLFVAEKMAALQVVKRKLDQAGLGDFCLELHSHKTQKKKVYEEINHRLGNQNKYRSPETINVDIARYEELKKQLNEHAALINSFWKNTGLSIHQILTAATRYREVLSINALDVHPIGVTGDSFDVVTRTRILDDIRLYSHVYEQVRKQIAFDVDLSFHPWYGVNNTAIQLFDSDSVCGQLQKWQDELERLADIAQGIGELLAPDTDKFDRIDSLQRLVIDMKSLPALSGKEYLPAISKLKTEQVAQAQDFLGRFERAHELFTFLRQEVRDELLHDQEKLKCLERAFLVLSSAGISQNATLEDIVQLARKLELLNQKIDDIIETLAAVAKQIGTEAGGFVNASKSGIGELHQLIKVASELESHLISKRAVCFDEQELDELLPKLVASLNSLCPQREALSSTFILDTLPETSNLLELRRTIFNGGMFKWFKKDWRSARKNILSLSVLPKAKYKQLSSKLDDLIQYQQEKDQFDKQALYKNSLGDWFNGLDTVVSEISQLRAWYKRVRQLYGIGFGPKVPLGQCLLDMQPNTFRGVQNLTGQGIVEQLEEILSLHTSLAEQFPNSELLKTNSAILNAQNNGLDSLRAGFEEALVHCQSQVIRDVSLSKLKSLLKNWDRFDALAITLQEPNILVDLFDHHGNLSFYTQEKNTESIDRIRATLTLATAVNKLKVPEVVKKIREQPDASVFASLKNTSASLEACMNSEKGARTNFIGRTNLDHAAWSKETGDKITELRTRNSVALTNPGWLSNWVDFVRCRKDLIHEGFERLIAKVERQEIKLDQLEDVFALATYDLLAREIISTKPALAHFSGAKQNGIQKQFREYDHNLKTLQVSTSSLSDALEHNSDQLN